MSAHIAAEVTDGRMPLFADDLPDSVTALIMVHDGRWAAIALSGVLEAESRTTTHAVAKLAYAVTRPLPEPGPPIEPSAEDLRKAREYLQD